MMTTIIRVWSLEFGVWIAYAEDNLGEKSDKSFKPNKEIPKNLKSKIQNPKLTQSGAALIGLLALMSLMALLLMAAAPSIQQQIVREKELEAIHRGDEIAEAIRLYAQFKGALPKRMDDLLEGVQIRGRTKKLMILRESAAKDPLSSTGEWKLIQSNDFKTLANFQSKVSAYTGSTAFSNPQPQAVFDQIARGTISTVIDIKTSEETDPPGGEDDSQNIDAPFVGVTSRSQTKAVMTFYGIERHDRWVFTPLFRGAGNGQNNLPSVPPPPPTPELGQPLP
jgi:type II secretory pathway pseudopilin PulG